MPPKGEEPLRGMAYRWKAPGNRFDDTTNKEHVDGAKVQGRTLDKSRKRPASKDASNPRTDEDKEKHKEQHKTEAASRLNGGLMLSLQKPTTTQSLQGNKRAQEY
jgi:hypothetical protein